MSGPARDGRGPDHGMTNAQSHTAGQQRAYAPVPEGLLRYLLYLPAGFDEAPDRRWPVLCFLHGRGEAASSSDGAPQPIETLFSHGSPPWHCSIDSPLTRDFIVLSPQLPVQRPWNQRDLGEISALLRTIYADFRGAAERTFLTGFSLGGRGTFDFAAWSADGSAGAGTDIRWAALWPVDDAAAEPRTECPVARVWLHFGTWKPDVQQVTAANLGLRQVPLYRPGNADSDRQYTDYAGAGCGHCPTCVAAYADPRVYAWLQGG